MNYLLNFYHYVGHKGLTDSQYEISHENFQKTILMDFCFCLILEWKTCERSRVADPINLQRCGDTKRWYFIKFGKKKLFAFLLWNLLMRFPFLSTIPFWVLWNLCFTRYTFLLFLAPFITAAIILKSIRQKVEAISYNENSWNLYLAEFEINIIT